MVDASREVDFFKECLPVLFDPEAPLVVLAKLDSLFVLGSVVLLWLPELFEK